MSTACCVAPLRHASPSNGALANAAPGPSIVRRPLAAGARAPGGLLTFLRAVSAAWREQGRRRAQRQAVAHLDRRLLVDVGLGEFALPHQAVDWAAIERARW